MKPTMRIKDFEMVLVQNQPAIRFSTPNDMVEIKLEDAERILKGMAEFVEDLRNRKTTPIPEPFKIDGEEFASGFECDGQENINLFGCVGQIGKQEIYLRDLVNLNKWIRSVLEAHSKMGCVNLKHIQEGRTFNEESNA